MHRLERLFAPAGARFHRGAAGGATPHFYGFWTPDAAGCFLVYSDPKLAPGATSWLLGSFRRRVERLSNLGNLSAWLQV